MKITHFLILLLLLAAPMAQPLLAQNPSTIDVNKLSDEQLQRIMQEIQSRGLSEDQAIEMAKAQGATQKQIDDLKIRMQQKMTPADSPPTGKKPGDQATLEKPTSPKAKITVSEKTKKIFGYQLFNSENLTFEPDVNIPIPMNYILGIGDQISISVWGASQTRYQLTVNKNGSINIPDVGPVFLSGVTFEKGQSLIKNSLMAIYSGMAGGNPNTWAEVSLGALRSIKVNVIGEINAPGTYTLPSTASAFNALYLSGGPNENGSFREIKLIRDGVTFKTIDVYDFLINANPAANVQLREQDIIFVPAYQTRVEISGEVKRPGLFEMKKGEFLSDLIRYAGNFTDMAFSSNLTVLRNNTKEREVRSVLAPNYGQFSLNNGDQINIDPILGRFSNRVAITGAVFHPGNYEYTTGMMLSELIKKADGIREDAFLNRAIISRQKEDNSLQNISFNVTEIVQGKGDIALRKEDKVAISSIFQLREERTVSIIGEVSKPGSFEYKENMTLEDLVIKAEGFREEADPAMVEVSRRLTYEQANKATDKMSSIFQLALNRDLRQLKNDASFVLMPFDEVVIRRAPGYRNQGTYAISGEVLYTGTFAIANKNERISDAIKRSGGLTPSAFLKGASLTRTYKLSPAEIEKKKMLAQLDTLQKKYSKAGNDNLAAKTESFLVGINLEKILENPGSSIDILLQPSDSIFIPRELQTIKISGSVMNPIALTYEKRFTLGGYIDKAGGYNAEAKKSSVYVLYPNGTTAMRRGFIFKSNPRITPGSEIIVPRKPEKKGGDNAMKWVSIASGVSALSITLITLINMVK